MLSLNEYANYFSIDLEKLLVNELGRFDDDTPAIAIIPPAAPANGTGLHIYIDRYANQITSSLYQQRINLVQLDRTLSGANVLQTAIVRIRDRYPSALFRARPYQSETALEAAFLIPITTYTVGGYAIPIVP